MSDGSFKMNVGADDIVASMRIQTRRRRRGIECLPLHSLDVLHPVGFPSLSIIGRARLLAVTTTWE
jgi:hypothetical protein